MRLRVALLGVLLTLVVGCEKPIPQNPNIFLDPKSIDFGEVYIGTVPQSSLAITNEGITNLSLSSVEKTGDAAFTMDGPQDTTVKGRGTTYVRILFRPQQARIYNGTLTINSNAENGAQQVIQITGVGVTPP